MSIILPSWLSRLQSELETQLTVLTCPSGNTEQDRANPGGSFVMVTDVSICPHRSSVCFQLDFVTPPPRVPAMIEGNSEFFKKLDHS